MWSRREVAAWAKRWRAEKTWREPLSAVEHRPSRAQGRDSPPVPPWLASHLVTFITLQTGSRASVQPLWKGQGRRGAEDEPKEVRMDNPSGMQRRSGWTWKVWVGIVVGLAVVAGLVVLIANAGGGSGGIY
jgi:hypothetical protein